MTATTATLPEVLRLDVSRDELRLLSQILEGSRLLHQSITGAHCAMCSDALGNIAGGVLAHANREFIAARGVEGFESLADRLRMLGGGG